MKPTLAAWLLLASAAFGQAPSAVVTGPSRPVPEGGAVVLNASKSASVGDLVWSVTPDTEIMTVDRPPQRFAFLPQPAPGEYLVTVLALGLTPDGKAPLGSATTIRVVVGPVVGPTPPPSPPPGPPTPDPDGKPGPVNPLPVAYAGPLEVTLVYDPTTRTPQLASLIDSTAIPAAFRSLPVATKYRTLNTTVNGQPSPEYARRGLAPFVAQLGGLPALVFQDPAGKVVHMIAAPADESGVLKAVNQLRGVK